MIHRFTLHFVVVALVAPTPLAAQPSRAPRDKSVVQTQLVKIEDDIARANRECDYAYFRRVEAAEFIFHRLEWNTHNA